MPAPTLNVALIGCDFIGRAHANTWPQVARFFADRPFEPVLKVLVGRTKNRAEAARAEKSIRCEKPLANSVPEAAQMLAAANSAGVIHMLCQESSTSDRGPKVGQGALG